MKDFIAPVILDLDINETAEGVYAGSGAPPILPQPSEEPGHGSCWTNWTCTWTGHNNGGHSICNVTVNHLGEHSGCTLVINFTTNFTIKEVKNASGLTISNVGTNSFTLTRNNFFNQSESVGFNFEITTSDLFYDENGNPLHGAIGANNADSKYCKVVSWYCS